MLKRVSTIIGIAVFLVSLGYSARAQGDSCDAITKSIRLHCKNYPKETILGVDPDREKKNWFELDITLTMSCADYHAIGKTYYAYGSTTTQDVRPDGKELKLRVKKFENAVVNGVIKSILPTNTKGKKLSKALKNTKNVTIYMVPSSLYHYKSEEKDYAEKYFDKIHITLSRKRAQRTVTLELTDFKEVEQEGKTEDIPEKQFRTWDNCDPFPDLSNYYHYQRS